MIKTALLATVLMATVVTESQARPQIWRVLEEVAIASVTPPPVYYGEQPRFYGHPQMGHCQPRRVVRECINVTQDCYGNRYFIRVR